MYPVRSLIEEENLSGKNLRRRRFWETLFAGLVSLSLITGGAMTAVAATANAPATSTGNARTNERAQPTEPTTDGSGESQQDLVQPPASPAPLVSALEPEHNFLGLTKLVNKEEHAELIPGQSFEYYYQISCVEEDCLNAVLSDPLPADLAGFEVDSFLVSDQFGPSETTWYNAANETIPEPEVLTAGDRFEVHYLSPLAGGRVGLHFGTQESINFTVKVPEDFSPNDPRNHQVITNTAKATADNSASVENSATIVVSSEVKMGVGITKAWTPATQPFGEGSTSTIALTAANTSNVPVDTLVVSDPTAAPKEDGAQALDAANPFRFVSFEGFDGSTLPTGADAVQVDAYVYDSATGTWGWVNGIPAATFGLPGGVDSTQVGGLRYTFTSTEGATIEVGDGAAAHITMAVAQRGTDRNGTLSDLSKAGYATSNVAEAETFLTSGDKVLSSGPQTASAPFTVTPPVLTTSVVKNFDPAILSKGESSTGAITATNTGSPVHTLSVSDLDYFDGNKANWAKNFAGFTSVADFPEGAVSGTVTYHFEDGSFETVDLTDGEAIPAPTAPTALSAVTGFVFDFAAAEDTNGIVANASSVVAFAVATNGAAADAGGIDFGGKTELTSTNKADSHVVAVNGNIGDATNTADLKIVDPNIALAMTKNVRPTQAVLPGQSVMAELNTVATPSVHTGVKNIVVEDSWGDGKDNQFWNGFNVTAIRPTQVPVGYTMTVEVQTAEGGWWPIATGITEGWYSLDEAAFASTAEAQAAMFTTVEALTGIKFTYTATADNNGGNGNIGALTVKPAVAFQARTDDQKLRDGGSLPTKETSYTNTVTGHTTGVPPFGPEVTGDSNAQGIGKVIPNPATPGPGPGSSYLSKAWNTKWILSQTGDTRSTTLGWNVDAGREQVTIADPGNTIPAVGDSVFDAFNVWTVGAIGGVATAAPYTNAWYLKWDTISQIELYNSTTSAWEAVPVPAGAWQDANRNFKGYNLTPAQQTTTVGVRITVVPDDAARTASNDPLAPRPGTGVTGGVGQPGPANATNRNFVLGWQLRDIPRSDPNGWVTAARDYNSSDKGIVLNTVELHSPARTDMNAQDDITIMDPVANVTVAKTVSPTEITVPQPGSVSEANYPTASYTVTAKNAAGSAGQGITGASKAQWVRLVDPNSCAGKVQADCLNLNTAAGAGADPWDNGSASLAKDDPFNWQNITKLTIGASIPAEVDLTTSTVWLLHYTPGTPGRFTTEQTTVTAANAMTADQLKDVVGFSVVFTSAKSTGPAGGGGLITTANNLTVKVDTQLRTTLRIDGAPTSVEPGKSVPTTNTVFAQLIRPEGVGPDDKAMANSQADLKLMGEKVDITPGKTITPDTLNEPERAKDVAVTLTANQGDANASPWKVVIEDQKGSTDFWNLFDFKSLGTITAPAGADQVQVDAYVNGDWVVGTPTAVASAALPAGAAADQVAGLRFTFTKAGELDKDGKGPIFNAKNAPAWSLQIPLTVVLRDADRSDARPIDFPRDAVTNTVYGQTFGKLSQSDEKSAKDDIAFSSGTREMAIGKWANNGKRLVRGGSTIPWDIVVENVGTGYLDLSNIADELPATLAYTGEGQTEGAVPYTIIGPRSVDIDPELEITQGQRGQGDVLTFDWTGHPSRLAPGEIVRIEVFLQLQPGVKANTPVTNVAQVNTVQPLDQVMRDGKKVPAVFPFDFDKYQAIIGDTGEDFGTSSDYVEIIEGTAIQVFKGVEGSLPGAENLNHPERTCVPFTGIDGKSYYRSPCVANSKQGSTDDWALRITNAGTTSKFPVFWVFDAFPRPNDKMLVAGTDRGSTYRPVLTGAPKVQLNDRFDPRISDNVTMQVTFDDNVCVGTWATLPATSKTDPLNDPNAPCNTSEWTTVTDDSAIDWPSVTGLRVLYADAGNTYDFPTGGVVDITYSTQNVLKDQAFPEGASDTIPVPRDQLAWNQFGTSYIPEQGVSDKVAPNKVGVRLLNGSIEVTKDIVTPEDGDMSQFVPSDVPATVTCNFVTQDADLNTVPTALKFADGLESDPTKLPVTLRWDTALNDGAGGYAPVRIHGIPVGSSCTVTEDGAVGDFGEYQRDPGSVTLDVTEADTEWDENDVPTNPVPEGQIAGLKNVYAWGGLSITKHVTTAATRGHMGPFGFELTCQTGSGEDVYFPVEGAVASKKATFTLEDGQTWNAPAGVIPAGSTCIVTETNNGGAGDVVFTGENVTDSEDGSGTIWVSGTEDNPTAVVSMLVDNEFPAGLFTVQKTVSGDGGEVYGDSFQFTASCTYKDDNVLDESFSLKNGDTKTFGVFPAGTQCSVAETKTGGATSAVLDPVSGTVTIAGPAAGSESPVGNVTLTATNTFDVGKLQINKVRDGAGAEIYGAGPFEAQVTCSYDKDGVKTPITSANLPGFPEDGKVILSAENGYTASINDLIVGAECTVEETDASGAHATTYDPGQTVTIPATVEGEAATVSLDIVNTFNVGSVKITKEIVGSGAEKYGQGPFEAQLTCSYQKNGETIPVNLVDDGRAILSAENGYTAQFDNIYVGADCSVEETNTNGAHTSVVSPDTFTVAESDQVVDVTITNTFNTGDLEIIKKVKGEEAATRGVGPFEAKVTCDYQVGDEATKRQVELPNDGVVTLSKGNGYRATLDGIYAGAECTVVETKNGGADSTTMDPADGKITIGDGKTATVTITNNFGKLAKTGAGVVGAALAAVALLGLGIFLVIPRRRGNHAA